LTGGIDQKHPRGHAKIKGIFEGRKFAAIFMNKMPLFPWEGLPKHSLIAHQVFGGETASSRRCKKIQVPGLRPAGL
jgi:hypothetical protein